MRPGNTGRKTDKPRANRRSERRLMIIRVSSDVRMDEETAGNVRADRTVTVLFKHRIQRSCGSRNNEHLGTENMIYWDRS